MVTRELRSIEIGVQEVAEEFGGEDPLQPMSESCLTGAWRAAESCATTLRTTPRSNWPSPARTTSRRCAGSSRAWRRVDRERAGVLAFMRGPRRFAASAVSIETGAANLPLSNLCRITLDKCAGWRYHRRHRTVATPPAPVAWLRGEGATRHAWRPLPSSTQFQSGPERRAWSRNLAQARSNPEARGVTLTMG
jgi:hypothetical protein